MNKKLSLPLWNEMQLCTCNDVGLLVQLVYLFFFLHITKHVITREGVWIQLVSTGVIFRSALSWWIMHHCASAKDAQTHKIDVLFTHMHSFNFLWGHLVATTGGRCIIFSTYSATLLSFIYKDASISLTFVCADTIHIQGTGQWPGLLLRVYARRRIFWVISSQPSAEVEHNCGVSMSCISPTDSAI